LLQPTPRLHERRDDIIILAEHFMSHYNDKLGKRFISISPHSKAMMLRYHWPGNIRELRNMVERIILIEDADTILPEHLSFILNTNEKQSNGIGTGIPGGSLDYQEVTRALIEKALKQTRGNVVEAAQLLNMPVHKLRYRIKKFGMRI